MFNKCITWINSIPLWKKIIFSIISFFVSIFLAIGMSLLFGINLIIHTSNLIRVVILIIIKKGATLLFINQFFKKIKKTTNIPPN